MYNRENLQELTILAMQQQAITGEEIEPITVIELKEELYCILVYKYIKDEDRYYIYNFLSSDDYAESLGKNDIITTELGLAPNFSTIKEAKEFAKKIVELTKNNKALYVNGNYIYKYSIITTSEAEVINKLLK